MFRTLSAQNAATGIRAGEPDVWDDGVRPPLRTTEADLDGWRALMVRDRPMAAASQALGPGARPETERPFDIQSPPSQANDPGFPLLRRPADPSPSALVWAQAPDGGLDGDGSGRPDGLAHRPKPSSLEVDAIVADFRLLAKAVAERRSARPSSAGGQAGTRPRPTGVEVRGEREDPSQSRSAARPLVDARGSVRPCDGACAAPLPYSSDQLSAVGADRVTERRTDGSSRAVAPMWSIEADGPEFPRPNARDYQPDGVGGALQSAFNPVAGGARRTRTIAATTSPKRSIVGPGARSGASNFQRSGQALWDEDGVASGAPRPRTIVSGPPVDLTRLEQMLDDLAGRVALLEAANAVPRRPAMALQRQRVADAQAADRKDDPENAATSFARLRPRRLFRRA